MFIASEGSKWVVRMTEHYQLMAGFIDCLTDELMCLHSLNPQIAKRRMRKSVRLLSTAV